MSNEELNPGLDDSPNTLLTKRIMRAESDNVEWQVQYQALLNDYMIVLSGADAVLKAVGDPLILEEVYSIVKEKDEGLANLFRPLVDMISEFNYKYILVTGDESGDYDEL
jgi:hypothetical protein